MGLRICLCKVIYSFLVILVVVFGMGYRVGRGLRGVVVISWL